LKKRSKKKRKRKEKKSALLSLDATSLSPISLSLSLSLAADFNTTATTYALATLLSGGSPRAEAVCVIRRWRTIESSSSPKAETIDDAIVVRLFAFALLYASTCCSSGLLDCVSVERRARWWGWWDQKLLASSLSLSLCSKAKKQQLKLSCGLQKRKIDVDDFTRSQPIPHSFFLSLFFSSLGAPHPLFLSLFSRLSQKPLDLARSTRGKQGSIEGNLGAKNSRPKKKKKSRIEWPRRPPLRSRRPALRSPSRPSKGSSSCIIITMLPPRAWFEPRRGSG
jgi:hypothetical protein